MVQVIGLLLQISHVPFGTSMHADSEQQHKVACKTSASPATSLDLVYGWHAEA